MFVINTSAVVLRIKLDKKDNNTGHMTPFQGFLEDQLTVWAQ